MNKEDKKIFNFIMSLTEYQYDVWLETINDEYADYANQLFEMAHADIDSKMVTEFDDAKSILARFRLKA
jgi:hypothetical protein